MMYHLVCPVKYRKVVFSEKVERVLKEVCLGIEDRYDIEFLEIGVDKDHVHFLLQSVPMLSTTRMVMRIKSITAREIFKQVPEVKKQLWGGEFWGKGYFLCTVGRFANEKVTAEYVRGQGKDYKSIHKVKPGLDQLLIWSTNN